MQNFHDKVRVALYQKITTGNYDIAEPEVKEYLVTTELQGKFSANDLSDIEKKLALLVEQDRRISNALAWKLQHKYIDRLKCLAAHVSFSDMPLCCIKNKDLVHCFVTPVLESLVHGQMPNLWNCLYFVRLYNQ